MHPNTVTETFFMEHYQNKFIAIKGRKFQGKMKDYATTHTFALALYMYQLIANSFAY